VGENDMEISEMRGEMLLGEEIHRRLERKYDGNVKEN
jgi:hypothetical protein